MLINLGPDWDNQIINTDHIVCIENTEYGTPENRHIKEIVIKLVAGASLRWLRMSADDSRGSQLLEDLKRRLHVQPADWSASRSSVETLEPI